MSSTFYDLRYARESIKRFIDQFGYVPVLSEEGAVFFDPKTTAAEACLREVSNASMLVLLIGGRFGMSMPTAGHSVTNAEYQQAVKDGVPVFAMVEQGTYNDYLVYQANSVNKESLNGIVFPNADDVRIFEFIDSVRGRSENNALVPFRTISDIETYLRSQWAGMMNDFLASDFGRAKVASELDMLAVMNARVEVIASQILKNVGTPLDRVYVALLQAMVENSAAADLRYFGAKPKPGDILSHVTGEASAKSLGVKLRDYQDSEKNSTELIMSSSGNISAPRRRQFEVAYKELRGRMLGILSSSGVKQSDVLKYEADLSPLTEVKDGAERTQAPREQHSPGGSS